MNGFVYVATGAGYVAEAMGSAASLRAAMPDAKICLVSDESLAQPAPFDEVIVRRDVRRAPIDKLLAIEAPFDRIVFLDTDTLVVGDLSGLFDVLGGFDIAALPETKRGWHYSVPGLPNAFAEFNTGVLAFRRNDAVHALFASWRAAHDELGHASDQPGFRVALWRSNVRVAPLPSEYHFLGNVPNYVMWDAKLIHARGDVERIARDVNRVVMPRVYLPDVGVLHAFHGRRGWVKQLARVGTAMSRLLVRRPTDAAGANPSKWWLADRRPNGTTDSPGAKS